MILFFLLGAEQTVPGIRQARQAGRLASHWPAGSGGAAGRGSLLAGRQAAAAAAPHGLQRGPAGACPRACAPPHAAGHRRLGHRGVPAGVLQRRRRPLYRDLRQGESHAGVVKTAAAWARSLPVRCCALSPSCCMLALTQIPAGGAAAGAHASAQEPHCAHLSPLWPCGHPPVRLALCRRHRGAGALPAQWQLGVSGGEASCDAQRRAPLRQ